MNASIAALALLILGIAYCVLKSGVQWPAGLIFTLFGIAIAKSQVGQLLWSVTLSVSTTVWTTVGQLFN